MAISVIQIFVNSKIIKIVCKDRYDSRYIRKPLKNNPFSRDWHLLKKVFDGERVWIIYPSDDRDLEKKVDFKSKPPCHFSIFRSELLSFWFKSTVKPSEAAGL